MLIHEKISAPDTLLKLSVALDDALTTEGAWRRGARAQARVPRSAARRVPVSAWPAQSPGAGGRQRGV